MPLLSDAKSCLVGQTQIKKIYAGTQLVWPNSLTQQMTFLHDTILTYGYYCFYDYYTEWKTDILCRNTSLPNGVNDFHNYEVRINKGGVWESWRPCRGVVVPPPFSSRLVYVAGYVYTKPETWFGHLHQVRIIKEISGVKQVVKTSEPFYVTDPVDITGFPLDHMTCFDPDQYPEFPN